MVDESEASAVCDFCGAPLAPTHKGPCPECGRVGTKTRFDAILEIETATSKAVGKLRSERFEYDIFLCYASEDRETVARPLAEALQAKGLRVWYDEFTLKLGASLRSTITKGLDSARFDVVVLSPNFLRKPWPRKELDALVARQSQGKKVILPVWHHIRHDELARYSPMLASIQGVSTDGGLDKVASRIDEAVRSRYGELYERVAEYEASKKWSLVSTVIALAATCISALAGLATSGLLPKLPEPTTVLISSVVASGAGVGTAIFLVAKTYYERLAERREILSRVSELTEEKFFRELEPEIDALIRGTQ